MSSFVLFSALALAFYLASTACYGAAYTLDSPSAPEADRPFGSRVAAFGRPLLILGIVTQTIATGLWCVLTHLSPFAAKYGTLSVFAWTLAIIYLGFEIRFRLKALGAAAMLIVSLFLFWALLHSGRPPAETRLIETQVISLHVMAILISYSLFTLAFVCALLYLIQNRLLKARKVIGTLRRIPPLATLDNIAFQAVAYGLPLLTAGLALGIAYLAHLSPPPAASIWLKDPHNLAAYIVWLIYAFYLVARMALGWRGVRLQYILITGLLIALLLYIVPGPTHRFKTLNRAMVSLPENRDSG